MTDEEAERQAEEEEQYERKCKRQAATLCRRLFEEVEDCAYLDVVEAIIEYEAAGFEEYGWRGNSLLHGLYNYALKSPKARAALIDIASHLITNN
jgi:hypothetical protein